MEIRKVAKTLKQINAYIKAFEVLFDKKPVIKIKGKLTSEHDTECDLSSDIDYIEVKKITAKYIYLKSDNISEEITPYYLYDNEYYHVFLN